MGPNQWLSSTQMPSVAYINVWCGSWNASERGKILQLTSYFNWHESSTQILPYDLVHCRSITMLFACQRTLKNCINLQISQELFLDVVNRFSAHKWVQVGRQCVSSPALNWLAWLVDELESSFLDAAVRVTKHVLVTFTSHAATLVLFNAPWVLVRMLSTLRSNPPLY